MFMTLFLFLDFNESERDLISMNHFFSFFPKHNLKNDAQFDRSDATSLFTLVGKTDPPTQLSDFFAQTKVTFYVRFELIVRLSEKKLKSFLFFKFTCH